jgi:hypothetical protein
VAEELILSSPTPTAGRVRRGLVIAIALGAFAWFFVAAIIGGVWLMPGGVAVAAFVLGALQRTRGLTAAQFLWFAGRGSPVGLLPVRRSPLNAVALGSK